MTQSSRKPPGAPTFADEPPPDRDEPDRALTLRIAPELYEVIASEAKAARHSINNAATILLEQALEARGKWKPPGETELPFWSRPAKGIGKSKMKKLVTLFAAIFLTASSIAPASACHYDGCDYDDTSAAIGFGMAGHALGKMAGAAAQQAAQPQAPVCYAPNGNPYYAMAWRGQWRC